MFSSIVSDKLPLGASCEAARNGEYLHVNISACCVRGTRMCDCLCASRGVAEVYHWHSHAIAPEINRRLLYARSHARATWAQAKHRSIGSDRRHQNWIDQSH